MPKPEQPQTAATNKLERSHDSSPPNSSPSTTPPLSSTTDPTPELELREPRRFSDDPPKTGLYKPKATTSPALSREPSPAMPHSPTRGSNQSPNGTPSLSTSRSSLFRPISRTRSSTDPTTPNPLKISNERPITPSPSSVITLEANTGSTLEESAEFQEPLFVPAVLIKKEGQKSATSMTDSHLNSGRVCNII